MSEYETKVYLKNIRRCFATSICELASEDKLPTVGNDIAAILNSATGYVAASVAEHPSWETSFIEGFRDVEFVHDLLVNLGPNGKTSDQFKAAFDATILERHRHLIE